MENVKWARTDETKLGVCLIEIKQENDLFNATLIIDNFHEQGIFTTEREAFIWLYGLKQWLNDKVAGYKEETVDGKTVYNKYDTKKRIVDVLRSKVELLKLVNTAYDEFSLKSRQKSDKITLSSLSHTLAGVLDAETLAKVTAALKRQ